MLDSAGKNGEIIGPGSYDLGFKNNHHIDAPKWTMRTKPDGSGHSNFNPGPGTYEQRDKTKQSGSQSFIQLQVTQ